MLEVIKPLLQFSQAIVFETSMMTYHDYRKNMPKVHACGINMAESAMSEDDQIRMLKKYADFYNAAKAKIYVKNVSSPRVLKAAIANGFSYVTGSAIKPAKKSYFCVGKLGLENIPGMQG
jgi:hypothetical protein